jgi:hypothetical protein
MSAAILAVLTVIENLIGVIGTSSATATIIDNIINALIQLLPLIIDEVSTVYASVKNIISLLQSSGAMTPAQQASLQQIDAQVDTAWNSMVNQIDPDNPANAGTPAGS